MISLDAVSQVGVADMATSQSVVNVANAPFSAQLQAEFDAVNTKLVTAEQELRDLAAGKQNNLHHVMLALEDAKLSFQLMVQVRNKVLDAYQDLMRMQI